MNNPRYPLIFNDISETALTELNPTIHVPSWLNGEFIRNAPSLFNLANFSLNHWFDGMSMLHRFTFKSGKVFYQSKFLESNAYLSLINKHALRSEEFATTPQQSWIKRIFNLIQNKLTDNNNVNIINLGKYYLAMTETDNHALIDPLTLSVVKPHKYLDNIKYTLNLAHPLIEIENNTLYNIGIKFGRISTYNIYKTNIQTNTRQIIAKIPTKSPSYMHSFAKTQNFFILYENPLKLSLSKLFFSQKPFIENYIWTDSPVIFSVISTTGKILMQIPHDNFFCFHMVNAFEEANKIYLDLIVYPNADIIQSFYLNHKVNIDSNITSKLCRYIIDTATNSCSSTDLGANDLEFPCINNAYTQKAYNFIYAVAATNNNFKLNSLIKLNLANMNSHQFWHQDDCYPGEPIFVPTPHSTTEDDGIIIVVVGNPKTSTSFLLFLDARSFTEITRVNLPHLLPMGLHGSFNNSMDKLTNLIC
ncbi:MAG: carotenoid oxygenase family protein [Burkholderiales bacterium]|nr:carotenoid oxygenase family protein [Burkholderiales bacterium]